MKEFLIEPLQERWRKECGPDRKLYQQSFDYCIGKVRENLPAFTYACPAEVAPNGKYKAVANEPWTTGFWPGMVWIAYAATKEEAFNATGKIQSILFRERLETDHVMQNHDIGFLFALSEEADYKTTGDENAKETAIRAAYRLTELYQAKAGIIQRGGNLEDLQDPFTGVFIVDCLMNVPLLFWAAEQTGDKKLYDIAYSHASKSVASIIRENGAVVQHGIADVVTGQIHCDSAPSQGKGGDDAAWGRGQAWAVYGFPLAYSYTGDKQFLEAGKAVAHYFLNRSAGDLIANWDLYYTGDDEQRDTSASAIAVCGLMELARHLPESDPDKKWMESAAHQILQSLIRNYQTKPEEDTMGLLNAGVYAMDFKGVDMPQIFGDYYHLEALYRCVGEPFIRFW